MTPQIPPALAALQRYYMQGEIEFPGDVIVNEFDDPDGIWCRFADVEKMVAAWPTQAQGGNFDEVSALEGRDIAERSNLQYVNFVRMSDYAKLLNAYTATHPSPSTAALREALSMLRECVEGEFGLQAWVDTYPCDHTPKLIESARTLLAGDKCG